MVSFDELQARRERRRRLGHLTLVCAVLVTTVWLITQPFPTTLL